MKNFQTIREVAKQGILTEYAIRLMLKSDNPPPHIKVNHKVLINYPLFIDWLNEQSRHGGNQNKG